MSVILSYLNQQKQWNDENDIQHVVDDLIRHENNVSTLHLTGNTLGFKAAEKLTEPLSKQSKINRLLWSDLFTGRGKDQIGFALKALSLGLMNAQVHLVELDLSDNAFGPNGVIGVTDLIASPCCYTLKVLNMNNQGLGHQGCRALVKAMKTARENSNKQGLNLEVFIAGRNRLENEGMEMLSEVFGDGMSSLRKLVLLQNGIGVYGIRGVENLIVAIRNHKNLKILNISDNNIKHNGMKLLYNVLPDFNDLEELYMDDCLLGRKGADKFSLIAEDKFSCPALKIISFSGNEMKSTAAMTLVNAIIEGKPLIEQINLRENEIKKTVVVEMIDLLKKFDKEEVFIRDEENSDDEEEMSEEGSSDDDNSSEEVSQDSDEESQSNENSGVEDEEDDEHIYLEDGSEQSEDDGLKENNSKPESVFETAFKSSNPTSGLFSTTKETPNLFGGSEKSSNLLNSAPDARTNLFSTSVGEKSNSGIFANSPTSSIFTKKSEENSSGGLFGNSSVVTKPVGEFTTGGLFGNSTSNTGLFGKSAVEKPNGGVFNNSSTATGLFNNNTLDKSNGGLFGIPATPNANLFTNTSGKTTSSGLFGSNASTGLFAKNESTGGLFGNTDKNAVDKPKGGLFGNSPAPKGTETKDATRGLFANLPPMQPTIFGGNKGSLFSFSVATDTAPKTLRDSIISGLKTVKLMAVEKTTLKVTDGSTVSKAVDSELKKLSESNPENGVRIGLILCEETNTFDLGLSMISHLLASPEKWPQSTNAILVEMKCIKCEEKSFVPFSESNPCIPVKVIRSLLSMDQLSANVKVNLRTALKELTKVASADTDDLLKDLDDAMKTLALKSKN